MFRGFRFRGLGVRVVDTGKPPCFELGAADSKVEVSSFRGLGQFLFFFKGSFFGSARSVPKAWLRAV